MFNFFKKQEENPITKEFIDLTIFQKMSVINLLFLIAICDGDKGDSAKEIKLINKYVDLLGVNGGKCQTYLKTDGHSRMINDLKFMSKKEKELLAVLAYEMIICDGRPNETELTTAVNFFTQIDFSEDEFVDTITKSVELMKLYNLI